jgi:adenylate cyclase class 2
VCLVVAIDQALTVHEVEVKYRLRDEHTAAAALAQRGVELSAPTCQDDQAYAPAAWRYGMSKIGVPFARLRTQDARHLFTVKTPVDNELACTEHETPVADREQMHGALLAMGFAPTVRIEKTRRVGRWGDVSVCVDVVQGIGAFLELERLVGDDVPRLAVQDELDALVRSLSVAAERTSETYDSLIRDAARG